MTEKEVEIKVESLEKEMRELRHGAQHGGGEDASIPWLRSISPTGFGLGLTNQGITPPGLKAKLMADN